MWRSARNRVQLVNGRADWYRIEKNKTVDKAEVYIYDEIGYWGTTAQDFIRDLRGITQSVIDLHLNSPGGDVFDGIAIYNGLKSHKAAVNVFVDGLAASAASFIAMAGDRIVMAPHSRMMIHEAFGLVIGNAEDMRKMADRLDATSNNIASIYAERAGEDTEHWRGLMKDETWYTDQEAVDAGLADEVGRAGDADSEQEAAKFDLSVFRKAPAALLRPAARAAEQNAGRPMSQANLDKLHELIVGANAIHGGTCDMGDGCPLEESADKAANSAAGSGDAEPPVDAATEAATSERERALHDLDAELAAVRL